MKLTDIHIGTIVYRTKPNYKKYLSGDNSYIGNPMEFTGFDENNGLHFKRYYHIDETKFEEIHIDSTWNDEGWNTECVDLERAPVFHSRNMEQVYNILPIKAYIQDVLLEWRTPSILEIPDIDVEWDFKSIFGQSFSFMNENEMKEVLSDIKKDKFGKSYIAKEELFTPVVFIPLNTKPSNHFVFNFDEPISKKSKKLKSYMA